MFKTTNAPRGYAASPHMKEGWVHSCAWLPTHQPSLGLILMTLLINSASPVNENSYKTLSTTFPFLPFPCDIIPLTTLVLVFTTYSFIVS